MAQYKITQEVRRNQKLNAWIDFTFKTDEEKTAAYKTWAFLTDNFPDFVIYALSAQDKIVGAISDAKKAELALRGSIISIEEEG